MSGNKFQQPGSTSLIQNKLAKISSNLKLASQGGTYQTQEALLFGAIKAMHDFYETLLIPQLPVLEVQADQLPDSEDYNLLWSKLLDDLSIIFTELENIEGLTVGNFNSITTDINRLTARIKLISSKLGDFILYSSTPSKDAIYYKDSFNDLTKVDANSSLLNATECAINQEEGVVTLPIDVATTKDLSLTLPPIINPDSNGVPGNNQEIGMAWHGDPMPMLDGNPDTWFAYERVISTTSTSQESLILDLVINLGKEELINHIRVNPNNFGTRTVILIDAIETSLDGKVYVSIKDDIPIAGFTTGDEENIFVLSPSTSKYAGQGVYSFTPRKVKYIRFVFRQDESYPIDTPQGTKFRYAIGLRDIYITGVNFKNKGEFVSKKFDTLDEIRKVTLQTNQNPTDLSELAKIEYFLSPDDGGTWYPIQPRQMDATPGVVNTIPEIIDFNGSNTNSIVTTAPVYGLRLKGIFTRNDSAFQDGSSTLRKTILNTSETHQAPAGDPYLMNLERAPVEGSIVMVDPIYGSCGLPQWPCYLASQGSNTYRIDIPYVTWWKKRRHPANTSPPRYVVSPILTDDWLHIEVAGERWLHATDLLGTYTGSDKVYTLGPLDVGYKQGLRGSGYTLGKDSSTGKYPPWVIQFGNGTNGATPMTSDKVSFWLEPERIFPNEVTDSHVAKLSFPTSSNKDSVVIKRYDDIRDITDTAPRQASVIRLSNPYVVNTDTIRDTLSGLGFTNKKVFQNGRDELTTSGDWTIDTSGGVVYLYEPLSTVSGVLFRYLYQPITVLSKDDWDWATTDILRDSISIKNSNWKTLEIRGEQLGHLDNSVTFGLSQMSIVKGSLTLKAYTVSGVLIGQENSPFLKEVPFQDGVKEIPAALKYIIELPYTQWPINTPEHVFSFQLQGKITTNTAYPVYFYGHDREYDFFQNEKGSSGACTSLGDYFIDRANRLVYVRIPLLQTGYNTQIPNVSYFIENPNVTDDGLYSVDYQNGQVHLQRQLLQGWYIIANYDYTDYRVEYKIARLVPTDHYEIDMTNRSIKLKENEVLKMQGGANKETKSYTINYDYVGETRETIKDLKGLFTPVLKDYALKILTKGKMF